MTGDMFLLGVLQPDGLKVASAGCFGGAPTNENNLYLWEHLQTVDSKLTRNLEIHLFHTFVQQHRWDVGHLRRSVPSGASQTAGFILMQLTCC